MSSPTSVSATERYSRQILFPGIGRHGQQALALARVAIVGIGATGAASASLLARAGVGHLTLIDRDFVESSNLQRQVLFDEQDAAEALPKAEAARRKLLSFNSSILVTAHVADLCPANVHELLGGAHLVLDGTDNFETRYLINDFAVQQHLPWIYAAAVGSYAATMNILPRQDSQPTADPRYDAGSSWDPTACLACVFPNPPSGPVETCDTAGILSTAVNLSASLQVTEALKILTGQFHLLRRSLVSVDLWQPTAAHRLDHAEISASKPHSGCAVCDLRKFTHLTGDLRPHITLCGRDSVQIHEHHRRIDLPGLQARLSHLPEISDLRSNSLLLRFRRGAHTMTVFPDGRALIQGTTDITVARALYARFIGS